ncbi:MAG TPA: PIG-L family deacetylase [Candidatus Didemnitutus sp.]|nr:PIG-L family deacetylase [Candidatus Didemnitutus sp.]
MARLARTGIVASALGLLATLAAGASAPADTPAALQFELQRLRETGGVLYLAAHPDDENTELITYLSRGRHVRTAYLSLTRGDGGQNELGRDFDASLGVLRTQELLAARRLDGGRQFFSRAIDFGFSKSPEETLRIWNHDAVLSDVVRVIREFRPDVIITRFPIPPGSGGHGHHTASAILAVEAFKIAGDPKAYPEQIAQGLAPWQPKRILWNAFNFGGGPLPLSGPTFEVDIAGKDPVSGESFGSIAARSRAMHKTQGLGGFTSRVGNGPNVQNFLLLGGDAAKSDFFDGIDTTWAREPGGAEVGRRIDAVIAAFKTDDPAASVPALLELRTQLGALAPDPVVTEKRHDLDHLILGCLGLHTETTIDQAEIVTGSSFTLHHSVSVTSTFPVQWLGARYAGSVERAKSDAVPVRPDRPVQVDSQATLPLETPLSQPYWLRDKPTTGLYTVKDPALIGRPENPPVFPVAQIFDIGGQEFVVESNPVQVVNAATEAASRRPLLAIGPVSFAWKHPLELLEPGHHRTFTLEVTPARAGIVGTLLVTAPSGWQIAPAQQEVKLGGVGESSRFTFELAAPNSAADGQVEVRINIGAKHYHRSRQELAYAHLPTQLLQFNAALHVVAFGVTVNAPKVGYVPGAGDSIPDALAALGCEVVTLTGADLTPEKLSGLSAVVLGVRAFNERTDLADHLPALWAWVESGGTVIAQYNRPNGLKATHLGPYELSIAGDAPRLRVTDETAPVTFLAPDNVVLNQPNKIGPADFANWVQERGAYFPSSWDQAHFVPILAMNDPGEAPLQGSLLVATYGKGHFVYTGLSFFRQLPSGNPGAYRLFANLLSLGQP